MRVLPLILTCISLGILGQLSLKKGLLIVGAISFNKLFPMLFKAFTNPYVLLGFSFYVISSILWLVVVSRAPLSYAYPLISIGYVIIVFLSWLIFKEDVPLVRWLGVAFICFGVCLVAQS
ncbi:MAG: 4-amino-4-deoxy-L-arabinose transferase [Armatimonadetes bacterium CG07_land_8_20_14_0_80_40_9]|nr:MAG: 4-amino-4-deoxy-L-arabinose transferase [Armatimonadetes bacterium CG07_land_8_20_14_0_80_40_9]